MSQALIKGFSFDSIEIGQRAEFSKQLTSEIVDMFAAVSGDLNPVHLDADYASQTDFGERIGHGVWVASVISASLAMALPGPGSIYRSQQIRFKAPVFIGDTVTVKLEVTNKKARSRLVELECRVLNQDDKLVAQGVAEVIAPQEAVSVEQPDCPVFHRADT